MAVMIEKKHCRGCAACLPACPWRLLHLSAEDELNAQGLRFAVLEDAGRCRSCGRCAKVCTTGALSVPLGRLAHALLDEEDLPPHVSCQLGTLAAAIADVAQMEGFAERLAIFRLHASETGLHIETHAFAGPEFFEEALAFKREHSERLVLIVSPSAKRQSTELSIERYRKLGEESVTVIDACDWFETVPDLSQGPTASGGDCLALLVAERKASFIARGTLEGPEAVLETERLLAEALRCQDEGKPFSLVQVLYPCFYRLLGRPQRPFAAEELDRVRAWFAAYFAPSRTTGVLLDQSDCPMKVPAPGLRA